MAELQLPVGLATSVGPLPHTDPFEAARFILRQQPALPAAPSLPNRSPLERRVPQAAWEVPGIIVQPDGSIELDTAKLDPEAPLGRNCLRGDPYQGLQAFVAVVADRVGPAKFQVTGPVSLGVGLGVAGVEQRLAFRIAKNVVRHRLIALNELVAHRAPGVQPVVVIDEPSLGSSTAADFPLDVEVAVDLVSGALAAAQALGNTAGLRCGPGSDWAVVAAAGPQLLTLPVSSDIVDHAGLLAQFLDRGGRVIWGAAPTAGPMSFGVDRMWRDLAGLWCSLVQAGVDPIQVRSQALISPAAGLGRHTEVQAAELLTQVDDLAKRLYDQATGMRLSVGA